MTDHDWLQENIKRSPTRAEVYVFSERVRIKIDGGMDEDEARRLAFKSIEKLVPTL